MCLTKVDVMVGVLDVPPSVDGGSVWAASVKMNETSMKFNNDNDLQNSGYRSRCAVITSPCLMRRALGAPARRRNAHRDLRERTRRNHEHHQPYVDCA